jgi:hypothetical protein
MPTNDERWLQISRAALAIAIWYHLVCIYPCLMVGMAEWSVAHVTYHTVGIERSWWRAKDVATR